MVHDEKKWDKIELQLHRVPKGTYLRRQLPVLLSIVKKCAMNHGSTCANALLDEFPEAEVVYCGNHIVKTFHPELEKGNENPLSGKVSSG